MSTLGPLVLLLLLLLAVALVALFCRIERVREELRCDSSGALSLRAVTLAFREMERGAIVMLEFHDLPVRQGGADEDRLLAQARRILQAELRETDVIGRRGCGFVVLLPGASALDASRKMMRMRVQLSRMRPRVLQARFGVSHTDCADAWQNAAEQLQAARFPDHFPPPGAPACVPVAIAADIEGRYQALARAQGHHVAA